MESILLKVTETEELGLNYVFLAYDASAGKAILRCCQVSHLFLDDSNFIEAFIEFFTTYYQNNSFCNNNDTQFVSNNELLSSDDNNLINLHPNYNMLFHLEKPQQQKIKKVLTIKSLASNIIEYKKKLLNNKPQNVGDILNDSLNHIQNLNEEAYFIKDELKNCDYPDLSQETKSVRNMYEIIMSSTSEDALNKRFDNEEFIKQIDNICYKCIKCDKCYKNMEAAETHCRRHINDTRDRTVDMKMEKAKMYECNICDKSFTELLIFKLHIYTHQTTLTNEAIEKKKIFECPTCKKGYVSQEKLKKHEYNVHQESYSTCHVCSKLIRARKMKEHLTMVHRDKVLDCPKCPKRFKWNISLQMHLQDHDAAEAGLNGTFKCKLCKKSFVSGVRLRNHTRRCSKNKIESSILCFVCGSNFSSNASLIVHMRAKHPDERVSGIIPFEKIACNICSKTFITKAKLKAHLRCHSGEKPFKCKFCEKAFAFKHYLVKHNRNLYCLIKKPY